MTTRSLSVAPRARRPNGRGFADNPEEAISRPLSAAELTADRLFRALTRTVAWATVTLVFYLVWNIAAVAQTLAKRSTRR